MVRMIADNKILCYSLPHGIGSKDKTNNNKMLHLEEGLIKILNICIWIYKHNTLYKYKQHNGWGKKWKKLDTLIEQLWNGNKVKEREVDLGRERDRNRGRKNSRNKLRKNCT